jgi:hypothetical protein
MMAGEKIYLGLEGYDSGDDPVGKDDEEYCSDVSETEAEEWKSSSSQNLVTTDKPSVEMISPIIPSWSPTKSSKAPTVEAGSFSIFSSKKSPTSTSSSSSIAFSKVVSITSVPQPHFSEWLDNFDAISDYVSNQGVSMTMRKDSILITIYKNSLYAQNINLGGHALFGKLCKPALCRIEAAIRSADEAAAGIFDTVEEVDEAEADAIAVSNSQLQDDLDESASNFAAAEKLLPGTNLHASRNAREAEIHTQNDARIKEIKTRQGVLRDIVSARLGAAEILASKKARIAKKVRAPIPIRQPAATSTPNSVAVVVAVSLSKKRIISGPAASVPGILPFFATAINSSTDSSANAVEAAKNGRMLDIVGAQTEKPLASQSAGSEHSLIAATILPSAGSSHYAVEAINRRLACITGPFTANPLVIET